MEEVVLLIDDLRSLSGISRCRICHEEEFESFKELEAPCACSGTVKVITKPEIQNLLWFWETSSIDVCFVMQFAHRDCIQTWCDEKGNTTCEICLQVRGLLYCFLFQMC